MTDGFRKIGRWRDLAHSFEMAAADLARCLRFSTRLPIPILRWETDPHAVPGIQAMARMLPVAGALIGGVGAGVLTGALAVGLGSLPAATLAVATVTLVTGALHEDALADTADGFGGGTTPQRRLEIMKDSRIGSFGAAALALALLMRIAMLATLADRLGLLALAGAMVLAAALSRAAGLMVFRLPPARPEGASYQVGAAGGSVGVAWIAPALIALTLALPALLPWPAMTLGIGLSALVAVAMTRLSARLVGGHTGDVAGAVQQLSEIAALLGLLIAVRP